MITIILLQYQYSTKLKKISPAVIVLSLNFCIPEINNISGCSGGSGVFVTSTVTVSTTVTVTIRLKVDVTAA